MKLFSSDKASLKCSDITMPIVADIHFSHRLAVESAAAGADKIRINPGNIGDESRVKEVVNELDGCTLNSIIRVMGE